MSLRRVASARLSAALPGGGLVIERSRDATRTGARDVIFNYGANAAYLKKVFQP